SDEDPKEDPKEDHADYPADGGDGDYEPSDDDNDTDDEDEDPFEDEDDEEEEEDHLALADSSVVPVVDPVPSAGDTKAFETDESAPTPRSPQTKVPFAQTHSLTTTTNSTIITTFTTTIPTSLPLPLSPLPPLPASLFIPPPVDHREDIPEAELPPRNRLCLTVPTSRYEVGESSTTAPRPTEVHRADYGFIGTIDAKIRRQRAKEEALVSREAWAHSVGLSSAVHYELQAYRTHTQMKDYRIASQESLMTTLIAQVSSLQEQLSVTLGQIQALQARDQTHADDPEGAASTAVGLVFSFLVSDNHNNMPPRRTSAATAKAAAARAAATAAATPMIVVAVE
ncbi:hypothetical protein Tco_1498846, partial [Tanacetum coccineum]